MRFAQKKKLIQAIGTMKEAHGWIAQWCKQKAIEPAYDMLVQLQEMAMQIGWVVEGCERDAKGLIEELEGYCEQIYECSVELENCGLAIDRNGSMLQRLVRIEDMVKGIEAKIKIAFFPYKYSMWDSLESIWIAADKDENCECQVIPIPYYTRDKEGQFSKMHYEGMDFEGIGSVMDYREYILKEERPDIMYIHNPYDEYNKVTMVEPGYFSEELKKYGGILVYVPYYLSGGSNRYENLNIAYYKGAVNSDFIILQSEALKEAYKYWGFPERRLLVLGSPKIDAVRKLTYRELTLSGEWERVCKGKKVILLNTSINNFLDDRDWLLTTKENIATILREDNMAVIWRPHPLLWDTVRTLGSDRESKHYEELVRIVTEAENAVMDGNSDASAAIKISDAMISDYSSLILQYIFTEKPAFLWDGSSKEREKYIFCNFYGNYFHQDGISLEAFLEMVKRGEDFKKEERLLAAASGMENTDGTCGEKVHAAICSKLMD